MSKEKNKLYWAYNLPLQVWPIHEDEDDEKSPVIGTRVLNYMPRRGCCQETTLEELEVLGEETREEFFNKAADILEHLASLMRKVSKDPNFTVYYPH